jgi:DNA modification methylase
MTVRVLVGDCREMLGTLPDASVNCVVTSPPYFGLRDYGHAGQIGLEATPDEYVAELITVFREVHRVLRDDGTLWLNLGDSYAANRGSGAKSVGAKQATNVGANLGKLRVPEGLKEKDLIGIPWRVAFALQADGWYLRQDIIWHKPNPMPESVADRCTKAHEYVFLLSKGPRYFYDAAAIAEDAEPESAARYKAGFGGAKSEAFHATPEGRTRPLGDRVFTGKRNKRSVWPITTQPYSEAHFATMAPELAETCVKAGTRPGDTVLDPFGGAGTTGLVADKLNRNAILIELNPEYAALARDRVAADAGMFGEVA